MGRAIWLWSTLRPKWYDIHTSILIISASVLLITGGKELGEDLSSAEVWAPGGDGAAFLCCNLPSMNKKRGEHTLTTGGGAPPLVCGGSGSSEGKSPLGWVGKFPTPPGETPTGESHPGETCEQLTGSGWELLDGRITSRGHSAWRDPSTGTTYLLGKGEVEAVTSEGVVSKASWEMKHGWVVISETWECSKRTERLREVKLKLNLYDVYLLIFS